MDKPLKILIASDSYKGTLSSLDIAEIFARIAENNNSISVLGIPIADGGEGTLEAIAASGEFELKTAVCRNPLFKEVCARYAVDARGRAFVEMAQASGLTLIEYADGNAEITTTYGTGQLIAQAVKEGATEIFVSVGGSATNDGGIGALAALGYGFFDKNGNALSPIGKNLGLICSVDCKNALDMSGVKLTIIADVDNPLLGERGATRFYGKQKGAIGTIADELEIGMRAYADLTFEITGVRLHDLPHAGAAGGLAGGLIAFLGAEVKSGIDAVLDLIGFEKYLAQSDAVVTGEGRLDIQSLHGKAVSGICRYAKNRNIPVYVMCGCVSLAEKEWRAAGIRNVVTLAQFADSVEDSMRHAEAYAKIAADKLMRLIAEDK